MNVNFWDSSVWSFLITIAILFSAMILAHILKQIIPALNRSLIPSSVLGGVILLVASTVCYYVRGDYLFNLGVLSNSGDGIGQLEVITYHCLAIGFIATALRRNNAKIDKQRSSEIFNTGVTTVGTYLLQGVLGLSITLLLSITVMPDLFGSAGILLPFGFGQGTGQALNFGTIYEALENGFVGGASFGLTIAALGFLTASIVGVIYLNVMKKKGLIKVVNTHSEEDISLASVQGNDEIPMSGGVDKMSIQLGIVIVIYVLSYLLMMGIGVLIPSANALIFGFNFLIGTLIAVAFKKVLDLLKKKKVVKREYLNSFLMNRIAGTAFDIMILSGIAAIQIHLIAQYWWLLITLAVVGGVSTLIYVNLISKRLFPSYRHEQFLAMFGMLTGTACTGMILLREIDDKFTSPVADNLIYQNIPAIILGFPMMLLANYIYTSESAPYITLIIMVVLFVVMNLLLFRNRIFRKKPKIVVDNNMQ